MTAINNSSLPINLLNSGTTPTSPAANLNSTADQPSQSANIASFGPAVTIDLSAPAQSIIDGASGGSNQSPPPLAAANDIATSSAAPVSPSNSAPVSSSLQYDPVAATVSSAKHRIEAQVGVVGANEVVDKHGTVNKAKLAQLVAEEQTEPSSTP